MKGFKSSRRFAVMDQAMQRCTTCSQRCQFCESTEHSNHSMQIIVPIFHNGNFINLSVVCHLYTPIRYDYRQIVMVEISACCDKVCIHMRSPEFMEICILHHIVISAFEQDYDTFGKDKLNKNTIGKVDAAEIGCLHSI